MREFAEKAGNSTAVLSVRSTARQDSTTYGTDTVPRYLSLVRHVASTVPYRITARNAVWCRTEQEGYYGTQYGTVGGW